MNYSEIDNLAMALYENGADIPVSALSVDEHGARYVHIEANPKTVSFWESEKIPCDTDDLCVSKVINSPDWHAIYYVNQSLYNGHWELCNVNEFNKELMGFIDRYTGQLHNLWTLLYKVHYDKLL